MNEKKLNTTAITRSEKIRNKKNEQKKILSAIGSASVVMLLVFGCIPHLQQSNENYRFDPHHQHTLHECSMNCHYHRYTRKYPKRYQNMPYCGAVQLGPNHYANHNVDNVGIDAASRLGFFLS